MNQKQAKIVLSEFAGSQTLLYGNSAGKEVFSQLKDFIDAHYSVNLFEISLEGIKATDASFPRESIVALAKQYRGEKGFFLTGITHRDLIDNCDYAAKAKEQPLVIWSNDEFEIIGPTINSSMKNIVDYAYQHSSLTTSMISEKFDLSAQNASAKLKKLSDLGYLLRIEEVAESGGREFRYLPMKKSD